MNIFLDFDGVLRRNSSPKARLDEDCVRNFEAAVVAHPDARVIISSTWRLVHRLDALRRLFSSEFAPRIVGVTPDVPDTEDYPRQTEIHSYINRNGLHGARWIAVDDDAENFAPRAPLILVDPTRGFDEECARRLRDWMAQ